MPRYYSEDELFKALLDMTWFDSDGYTIENSDERKEFVREFIDSLETTDVEPARHGRWIWDDEGYHCSECFFHAYGNTYECLTGAYRYCPNCGAKMDEVEE